MGPYIARSTPAAAAAAAVTKTAAAVMALLLFSGACSIVAVRGELRSQAELTSNCYDFPAHNFDPKNSIRGENDGHTPYLPMSQGDDAIDFTLHDLDGNSWNLREALLKGKPVVMIWGMVTCPMWQGFGGPPPFDKCTYWDQHDLIEDFKDRATFVHLYGAEPHPQSPGTNFDDGYVRPEFWSVFSQQRSYQDRLDMAALIRDYVHPDQIILPDYFPGNPYSDLVQPVWCSYAHGARPVTVISPDGKILFQRGWLHTDHVADAITSFWTGAGVDGGGGGRKRKCVAGSDADGCPGVDVPPISSVPNVGGRNK